MLECRNIVKTYSKGDPIMLRILTKGTPRYEAFEIE